MRLVGFSREVRFGVGGRLDSSGKPMQVVLGTYDVIQAPDASYEELAGLFGDAVCDLTPNPFLRAHGGTFVPVRITSFVRRRCGPCEAAGRNAPPSFSSARHVIPLNVHCPSCGGRGSFLEA